MKRYLVAVLAALVFTGLIAAIVHNVTSPIDPSGTAAASGSHRWKFANDCVVHPKQPSVPLQGDTVYIAPIAGAKSDAELLCRRLSRRFDVPVEVLRPVPLPKNARARGKRLDATPVPPFLARRFGIASAKEPVLMIGVTTYDIYPGAGAATINGDKTYKNGLVWTFALTGQYGGSAATLISTARLSRLGTHDREWRLQRLGERAVARHRYGMRDKSEGSDNLLAALLSVAALDGLSQSICDLSSAMGPVQRGELDCDYRDTPNWRFASAAAKIRRAQYKGLCAVATHPLGSPEQNAALVRRLGSIAKDDADAFEKLDPPAPLQPFLARYVASGRAVVRDARAVELAFKARNNRLGVMHAQKLNADGRRQDAEIDHMNDVLDRKIGERPLATSITYAIECQP